PCPKLGRVGQAVTQRHFAVVHRSYEMMHDLSAAALAIANRGDLDAQPATLGEVTLVHSIDDESKVVAAVRIDVLTWLRTAGRFRGSICGLRIRHEGLLLSLNFHAAGMLSDFEDDELGWLNRRNSNQGGYFSSVVLLGRIRLLVALDEKGL